MKFFNHSPLKGKKLQFVGRVLGLSLCQTPTCIGDGSISPILMRPASIGEQFKRLSKSGIGKNGCCGAQAPQVIKRLLVITIPGDGHPLLTCILIRCHFVQGMGYLCELGDEPMIVSHEPKKALELSDGGGAGPFLIASIFPSLVSIPWAQTMCPRYVICLWNSSQLEGLSFSLACSSLWNTASSLSRWLARSFKEITISSS